MKIGFIGFGEAAYNISSGLISNNMNKRLDIIAYDKMAVDDAAIAPLVKERAKKANVRLVESLEQLIGETRFILSATSSHVSIQVAKESAYYLANFHTFIDLNSSSPETKQEIFSVVQHTGATFVDAAILGSVPALKDKVPILISGNGSERFKRLGDRLKMNVEIVSNNPGDASAVKMTRSIFMKGLTALLTETLSLSNKLNINDYVINSINETLQNKKIEQLAQQLIPRTAIHAERRIGEMDEVMKTLQHFRLNNVMSKATKSMLETIANDEQFKKVEPKTYDQFIQIYNGRRFE